MKQRNLITLAGRRWFVGLLATALLLGSPLVHAANFEELSDEVHVGDDTGSRWEPSAPGGTTVTLSFRPADDDTLLGLRFEGMSDLESGKDLPSYDGHGCISAAFKNCDVKEARVTLYDPGGKKLWRMKLDSSMNGEDLDLPIFVAVDAVGPTDPPYTLEFEAGDAKNGKFVQDGVDDFAWEELDLAYAGFVIEKARFNAVEPGQSPYIGSIYTKVAGSPIVLDLASIDPKKKKLKKLKKDKRVAVRLLDALDNSGTFDEETGCLSTWGTTVDVDWGVYDIREPDDGGLGNPATITFPAYPNALRAARLLFFEFDPDNPEKTKRSSCSFDQFAIRPASFSMTATDATDSTPGTTRTLNGTTATSTPVHRAGQPFTVTLFPVNSQGNAVTGYDSQPTVSAGSVVLPAGGTLGVMDQSNWTLAGTTLTNNGMTYSEVGAFNLEALDDVFTGVDELDGTPLSLLNIGPVSSPVGRFVPDDFTVAVNAPELMPGCLSFSYLGQDINYAVDPVATVTAINADGDTTTNYTGALLRVSPLAPSVYSAAAGPAMDTSNIPNPDSTIADTGAGTFTVTLTAGLDGLSFNRGAPQLPFDADIEASFNLTDDDGIAFSGNPVTFGDDTPGNGIPFTAGGNQVRFGQMRLDNAYGSELVPLNMPIVVEYFDALAGGTQGFRISNDDLCTDGTAVNVAGDIAIDNSAMAPGAPGTTSATGLNLLGGTGAIALSAPNSRGSAPVSIDLAPSYPYLSPDTDGNTVFDNDPAAVATFGVYRGSDQKIYTREVTP